LAAYKDAEKLMKCPWISDWSDENVDAYKKVLLDISEKSASGWDQVIQSLTRLSILLIDTASSQIPTFFLKNGKRITYFFKKKKKKKKKKAISPIYH
jgi:hypothetical protein